MVDSFIQRTADECVCDDVAGMHVTISSWHVILYLCVCIKGKGSEWGARTGSKTQTTHSCCMEGVGVRKCVGAWHSQKHTISHIQWGRETVKKRQIAIYWFGGSRLCLLEMSVTLMPKTLSDIQQLQLVILPGDGWCQLEIWTLASCEAGGRGVQQAQEGTIRAWWRAVPGPSVVLSAWAGEENGAVGEQCRATAALT